MASDRQQQQQRARQDTDFSAYRTLRLETSHTVINTDLYPRPSTVSRDYTVLSWVFSEAPQLDLEPGSADALSFLAEFYTGWYPAEPDVELSLIDATKNLPSFIQTGHLNTNRGVLETFFAKYMQHYDSWAEDASGEALGRFKAATILKDVMYQHAFVHRPDHFNVHEAYTDRYASKFDVRELDDDVTWVTPLCTEAEREMASQHLSDGDIAAVEDYVGAVVQLLEW